MLAMGNSTGVAASRSYHRSWIPGPSNIQAAGPVHIKCRQRTSLIPHLGGSNDKAEVGIEATNSRQPGNLQGQSSGALPAPHMTHTL